MMSRQKFDNKMLEWCEEQEDFSLLDVMTYAWIISDEGKSINPGYVDRFIKKYLAPV